MRSYQLGFRLVTCLAAATMLSDCSTSTLPASLWQNGAVYDVPPGRNSIWQVVSSPNVPPGSDDLYDDTLYSVSGTSDGDVWAAGDDCCYPHGSQEYSHALFEHWDGSAWSIIP